MSDASQTSPWPLRSLLFVPAHRGDWVEKSARVEPDGVILDLEDAVVPDRKAGAREAIAGNIATLAAAGIAPLVRINALADGAALDVQHVVARGLEAVVLPKVNGPEDVAELDRMLSEAEAAAGMPQRGVGIVPLPETARGLWLSYETAAASDRVRGLMGPVSGPTSGDVAKSFGYQPSMDGEEQLYLQSRTILASRAAGGHHPLACVFGTPLDDLNAVEMLATRACRLGFTGVAAIHPSHVPVINRVFRPSEERIEYAGALLEALKVANEAGEGAVRFRGKMIDAAMAAEARAVLAEAKARARAGMSGHAGMPG